MPKIELSVMIASPPEDVFAAVSDVQHSPVWITALSGIRGYGGNPMLGATFTEQASFMGKALETGKEVVIYDPPRQFGHRSISGPVPQELIMSVEPAPAGSNLTVSFEAEPGGFFGNLPLNVLVVAMEVMIKGNLKKLKGMLERGEWPGRN